MHREKRETHGPDERVKPHPPRIHKRHRDRGGALVLPGLGNPRYSNIRVESFNPAVDVPNVCAMCADTPCVNACPVEPDPKTGRRGLGMKILWDRLKKPGVDPLSPDNPLIFMPGKISSRMPASFIPRRGRQVGVGLAASWVPRI
jgi:hypothetical protein